MIFGLPGRQILGDFHLVKSRAPRHGVLIGNHMAARAQMQSRQRTLHQLVASGIVHPAPPAWYARLLGGLARLGESPVADHSIALRPLPGRSRIYTPERNYLVLERAANGWCAWWETEAGGPTPALALT